MFVQQEFSNFYPIFYCRYGDDVYTNIYEVQHPADYKDRHVPRSYETYDKSLHKKKESYKQYERTRERSIKKEIERSVSPPPRSSSVRGSKPPSGPGGSERTTSIAVAPPNTAGVPPVAVKQEIGMSPHPDRPSRGTIPIAKSEHPTTWRDER